MDFNSALDIIIKDLREAHGIMDNLKQHNELPLIEIELAKAKCKSAVEILILLKELEPSAGKVNRDTVPEEEHLEESNRDTHTSPETVTENAISQETAVQPESLQEPPEPESNITAEKTVAASPGKSKQKGIKPILADRYKDSGNRISETISANKEEEDVISKIKKKPIGSLTDAIGINDRFYFIREIFGGNKETYNETINRLNSTGSLREAEAIIEEFGTDDRNSDAVEELMSLIRRKTGINE